MMHQPSQEFIVVEVTKNDILKLDLSVISKLLRNLSNKPHQYHNTVHILFGGYDYIPKEVFEIKEIRDWVEKLVFIHPEIIYYLEDEQDGLQNIFLCISDYSLIKKIQEPNRSSEDLLSAEIPHERAETILVQMALLQIEQRIMEQVTNRIVSFAK